MNFTLLISSNSPMTMGRQASPLSPNITGEKVKPTELKHRHTDCGLESISDSHVGHHSATLCRIVASLYNSSSPEYVPGT